MRKLLLCIFSLLILANTAQASSSTTIIPMTIFVPTIMMMPATQNNYSSELARCLNNGGGNACYIKNCLQNKGGNACYTKYKKERTKHEGN